MLVGHIAPLCFLLTASHLIKRYTTQVLTFVIKHPLNHAFARAGITTYEGGDVDREEGEHDYASDREEAAEDLARDGDWIDVASEGGRVHACPPQGIAEALYGAVGPALAVVEYEAAEIDE